MQKSLIAEPQVRFPGFMGPWNCQKLGTITDFVTGKAFSSELSDNGTYIVMDMGSVGKDGNRIETKTTNVERDLLCTNDLIMPKDDIGGGYIIGRTAYIPANEKYVLGDHVYRLRFEKEYGLFIHYQINSDYIRRQIKPIVTGSAQLGLNAKNLQKINVSIPCFEEQQTIADFLSLVDEVIEANEAEVQNLERQKKVLMK